MQIGKLGVESNPQLCKATLLHSSSLRMLFMECKVFRTAHTSNKEHTMQLHQNKETTNTVTQSGVAYPSFITSGYTSDYNLH